MERFGLSGSSALVLEGSERTSGLAWADVLNRAEAADLLVNISGHLDIDSLMSRLRRKAYVDLDPGFTQFWQAAGVPGARLEGHDVYFTVGENIGTEASTVPAAGIDWQPVRPPVVLDQWPVDRGARPRALHHHRHLAQRLRNGRVRGTQLGLKVHEFRKMLELPQRAPGTFEIALDIHPGDSGDLEELEGHGWQIVDPRQVARDPDAFRGYVQGSGAEFSVAQGVYVDTSSGWFSDRTAGYLASGKPALVQDTGLAGNYAVGEGLVSFRTLEEAIAGAERIGCRLSGAQPGRAGAGRAPLRLRQGAGRLPLPRGRVVVGAAADDRPGGAMGGDWPTFPRGPRAQRLHSMVMTRHFILIHVPRTGGQFIRKVTFEQLPGDWFIRNALDAHTPWELVADDFAELPMFAVIRNPWDWYVSWYHYLTQTDADTRTGPMWMSAFEQGASDFTTDRHPGLHRRGLRQPGHRPDHARARLRSSLRQLHADRRQGSRCRQGGAGQVREHAAGLPGLPATSRGSGRRRLRRGTDGGAPYGSSKRGPYQQYYDDELRDLVGRKARRLVELGGYEF